jgi:hypothetical protein
MMMYKQQPGFRLVAVGIFLTLADFRVNSFDLVPDWLGYALVAFGLGRLTVRNAQFNVAYPLACVLCMITLVAVFVYDTVPATPGILSNSPFRSSREQLPLNWSFSTILITVLSIALSWSICDGVRHFSNARGDVRAAETAARRRDQFVVLSLLWVVSLVLASASVRIGFFMIVGVGLCSFALDVALARLLWRVADAPSADQMLAHLVVPVRHPAKSILAHIFGRRHDLGA